jgi:outer membrane protein assembly factor BamB
MFSQKKDAMILSLISALAFLSACNPAFVTSPPQKVAQLSSETIKTHQIKLEARFDRRFRTACTNCRAEYLKLELRGPGHVSIPLYAIGADPNGFVKVRDNALQLSANLPEGPNWTAVAGLYSNPDPQGQPILQVGAAFHVPITDPQVEMDVRALQTAEIVNALHEIGSPKVLTPLQLQEYQSFTDALLGVEQQPDGTYQMNRLPAGQDPSQFLDSRKLAQLIEQGTIPSVDTSQGQNLNPSQMTALPEAFRHFRARELTAGLTPLVMNPSTNQLFSFDILQNTKRLYGLTSALSQTPFQSVFSPVDLGRVQNIYLSLGQANPTGQAPVAVIYVMEYTGLNRMTLKALSQTTGQVVWSYNFDNTDSLETRFIPVSQKDTRGTLTVADDSDIVYTALLADHWSFPGSRGIYALRDGQLLWRFSYEHEFTSSGALSRDGQALYLVTRSDPFTSAKLVAIKTQPAQPPVGQMAWAQAVDLGYEAFDTSTPVVGSDGTVYVNTVNTANQQAFVQMPGHLQAISPDGQLKWRTPLAVASFFAPIVSRYQGQDVIYTSTEGAKLHALRADGSEKWAISLPGTVGEGPSGTPTVGLDIAGQPVIYVPWGNGLIYAVRDHGNSAEVLWAQAPGGKNNRSLLLKDGVLYATTLDGGEGQWVQIRSFKVNTPNPPADAPWPMLGGNYGASGRSQLQE